jgi:catechol 2,3-dioxygenase-like lactoylglutathione lyase family enzyme
MNAMLPNAHLLKPIEVQSTAKVLSYAHLGLAVTDISKSIEWLSKVGFDKQLPGNDSVKVLQNAEGMEIHLFKSDTGFEPGHKNVLMDFPENKYPGHTHASFMVPSVHAAADYLQSNDIPTSGERIMKGKLLAVFARDPDQTTFEFENNTVLSSQAVVVQESSSSQVFSADCFGNGKPIDHIGIRVTDPVERLQWYAEHLGFVNEIMSYSPNLDPLKNGPPWISRTDSGVDINFIVNANITDPEGNILTSKGKIKPGIVYVAFIVEDVESAAAALCSAGVLVTPDTEPGILGLPSSAVLPVKEGNGSSVFLQDPDKNLIRLVSRM